MAWVLITGVGTQWAPHPHCCVHPMCQGYESVPTATWAQETVAPSDPAAKTKTIYRLHCCLRVSIAERSALTKTHVGEERVYLDYTSISQEL